MNGTIESYSGEKLPRIVQKSFDLEDPESLEQFIAGKVEEITVPGTQNKLRYDSLARIGIGRAVLDTSHAVSVGAYSFALNELDKRNS